MTRAFPTGSYVEALPSGAYAVLIAGSHIQTHLGRIALPPGDEPLYHRITEIGGFKIAGQAHHSHRTLEWIDGEWHDRPRACGVSPVIYDRQGVLHISNCGPVGSQGFRFVAEDGRIWTGDETYFAHPGVSEWSAYGGVVVGQGHAVGGVVVYADFGPLRVLDEGDCRFIRVNGDGERVAIAYWKKSEGAVIVQTTLAELRRLPVVPDSGIPNPPPPSPEPEPPIMQGITDAQFETLKRIRSKYPSPEAIEAGAVPRLTPREIGEILNAFAWAHRNEIGLQAKDGGTRAFQPVTGRGIWNGVWIKRHGDWGQDVLAGASAGVARPVRGEVYVGQPDKFEFVPPVNPMGEEPDDPPLPGLTLEQRVAALEAWQARVRA